MSELLARARRGEPLWELDITDLHGHLGAYAFTIPHGDPASLVAAMDRAGVRRIVCSHMQCMSARSEEGNRAVCDAMRAFPGRILGYLSLWPTDAATVEAAAARWAAVGFSGIKLHNINGFPYDLPTLEPAYALAAARRMPVLYHTWGQERELAEIEGIARRYPEIPLLLAHACVANEPAYYRLARTYPNIYLDPTLSKGPYGLLERMVEEVGAAQIVWGSDAVFLNQAQQLGRLLGARISDEEKRQICAGNAARILRL